MRPVSRRAFLSAAGASAVTARSQAQTPGASDRLRIGAIGCGGMGTGHLRALLKMKDSDNLEVTAVCDVYRKRLDRAAQLTGAAPYQDYRRLLENKNIDYVLIATPEHWHARMILDAAAAGKHIYCEKPMTQTSGQARGVAAAVARTGVKLQVGVQGMSDDSYETANRYVKAGALGDVVMAQIDYSRNYAGDFWAGPLDPDVRPGQNLDWNAWLGPAPRRPFDPGRFQYWRRYWDYSSGIASDLFIHRVTRIIKALDLSFPERGAASGGKWHFQQSAAEIPDTFNILMDYPGGPTVLLVSSMANDTAIEHVLREHKATLEFTRTGFVIRPQRLYAKELQEITHQRTGGEDITLHHRNLARAIRLGEPLKCDARLGYYGVVACEMGVRSFRRQKYVRWDRVKEKIVEL
ncbi:MAG: Gfo/Idh/MocA family oxidoreductase [Acidobacteria bacterium]|nr:Gfo/Idh/MocA family oxidoreductase [Acidobacteriota bacterium]